MAKYRKKPVVIEAHLWNPYEKPTALPGWFWDFFSANPELLNQETGQLIIPTLEGNHIANPGDYIIKGIKGELYPCKPDIFEATYEKVED